MKVVKIHRNGFTITYRMEDETVYAFRAEPGFCEFIMNAWEKRDACGFTSAKTPKGKESVIYVIPTTDGISLRIQPKRQLKIIHTERDDCTDSMVQITLEDE